MNWWWSKSSVRRLRQMMEAIRARDFTLQYSLDRLRGEERSLACEINKVISEFRDTLSRQEALYGQFETMLNQVGAFLFVDDGLGNIIWMNSRAIRDLCGFRIKELSMLGSLHPDLPDALDSLKPGQQRLLRLRIADHDVEWSTSMTKYYRGGSEVRLFSIENLQSVLQQNEAEAQRRLVSVLTHEIMNSLSPIISLSDTLASEWPDLGAEEAQQALGAIHRRSEGLLRFVDNYRRLSHVSPPHRENVSVGNLTADIQSLFSSSHIVYDIEDPTEEISIDRHQVEQVLINLLKNAEEACALTPEPKVTLSTHADRPARRFLISVCDNGHGIAPEALDRIFVPFFTTKEGGSGIGLSLCRQIVTQHGGIICVTSRPGHTVFTVQLPT